jgi:UDP-glucuronate decarboxylase
VTDLIEGLIRLMASPDDFTGPVNLGNEHEFTILELAERVIKLSNSSSKIVRAPLPADDPKQRKPDTALARQRLGWRATTELEAGLKRTIEYFAALLSSTAKA